MAKPLFLNYGWPFFFFEPTKGKNKFGHARLSLQASGKFTAAVLNDAISRLQKGVSTILQSCIDTVNAE